MDFRTWLLAERSVFHGSKSPVIKWDNTQQVSGYYPGLYAWPDPQEAQQHGEYVYQLDVDDSKFYRLQDGNMLKQQAREAGYPTTGGSGFQDAAYLKDQGYAGIIRGNEYIIFEPQKWSQSPMQSQGTT